MERVEALLEHVNELSASHGETVGSAEHGGGLLPPLKPPRAINPKHVASAQLRIQQRHDRKLVGSRSSDAILVHDARHQPQTTATPSLPAISEERRELSEHKERIFHFDHQYTFGLSNFDDKMVRRSPHHS